MEGPHTRRWLRFFVERGHDIHAVSFYAPRSAIPGVTRHSLLAGSAGDGATAGGSGMSAKAMVQRALPHSAQRLVQAIRYQRAGLSRTIASIGPEVFHAHFVVEHGFYGAFVRFHPYVVSAWGSDLYRAPSTPSGRWIARRALQAADLVTVNDPALGAQAAALGVHPDRLAVIRLGIDDLFFDLAGRSVNEGRPEAEPPTVISDRALERLYNVDAVIEAFAVARKRLPTARLLVANDGSQRPALEALAARLGVSGSVEFRGRLKPEELRDALARAHVYVSVPNSDSFSLSTMEAMAAGAFPVVSDLPSQEWIVHRVNGLRIPPRSVGALAESLLLALSDHDLRRRAVEPNRKRVWTEGRLETNMLLMERYYYRLAGRPMADKGGL
jgi:L-malate glycosyltransferase